MLLWLLNAYMDGVVREVNARMLGRGLSLVNTDGIEWNLNQLLFADDTALVNDSEGRLRQVVEEFGSMCKRRKRRVNESKSKLCKRRKRRVNESKSKLMKCMMLIDCRRMNVSLNEELLEEVVFLNI